MKKIKVAVFLVGLSGGAGQVVINYFSHMPANKYEVDIITTEIESEDLLKKYEDYGMRVYKITRKRESLIKNLSDTNRLLKRKHYDIAYAHMTLTNFFPLFISWIRGIKIRISHSHLAPITKKSLGDKILSLLTKCISTQYLACGTDAGHFLYGNSKFKVVKNAIDLSKYRYSDEERERQRKKIGISDDTKLIGHVGRFNEQKNHRFLIEVFAEYIKIYPNSKLILMGDGPLKKQIEQQLKNKGISEKVLFLGQVSDVNQKLMMLDAFILPSLFEGLSIAAIEIQAVGINSVFSDTVSIETDLTSNVKFLSLKAPVSEWVNTLHEAVEMPNNELRGIDELKNNGYDIEIEAKKFDQYLESLM